MPGVLHSLVLELKRAQQLMDAGSWDSAREVLSAALADARKRGVQSGHLHWMLAVAADAEGDAPGAVQHMKQALKLDPIAPPFLRSKDIIQSRLLQALHDPERPADHEGTGKLYEFAKQLGPVDAETHLLMVRSLRDKGEVRAALELVRAVLHLDPTPAVAELERELASDVGEAPALLTPPPEGLVAPA